MTDTLTATDTRTAVDAVPDETVLDLYRRPGSIPENLRVSATERLATPDPDLTQARMKRWEDALTGVLPSGIGYDRGAMLSNEAAIAWALHLKCQHTFDQGVSYVAHRDHVLDTYDHGTLYTCTKCDHTCYKTQVRKNWSGD